MGWIGDRFEDLVPHLFTDADFAGCDMSLKSTSGIHVCLLGPRSNFPLAGQSKRQNCISQSTTEAELVAASLGTKNYGISLTAFMKQVCRGLDARALPLHTPR